MNRPKIAAFFGTRPEAIKMAPVVAALDRDPRFDLLSVATGQHGAMLDDVVRNFETPVHRALDVMKPAQPLASLSARLITEIDSVLQVDRPDFALVQGDTATAFCAALACFYRRVPIGHVEAGLRTGNLASPFPEEANRLLISPLAKLHFAPTQEAANVLRREHYDGDSITITGNTVIDALQIELARQDEPGTAIEIESALATLPRDWREARSVLITGHRRENFGDGFAEICAAVADLAVRFPSVRFIYPVHLNPAVQTPVNTALGNMQNVHLLAPQSYRVFVALMNQCTLVLTDSGGVQEEAPSLGKPVLVMRDTTERPEGIAAGTVKLVGANRHEIVASVGKLLTDPDEFAAMANAINPYGDGRAAGRILDAVAAYFA